MGETPYFRRLNPRALSAPAGYGFLCLVTGLALGVWTLVCVLFLWSLDAQEKRHIEQFVFLWLTGVSGIGVGFWVARGRIAERRAFLSTLAAKEQLWRSILEGMQDPLMVLERDFRIRVINPAAAALTETTPQEAVGKSCMEVFSHWHKLSGACADRECAARRVLETGTACSRHMEILLPDGSSRVFHVLVSPLLENGAAVSGVIESFRDITEEARAQQELAREKRDLELLFENMFGGCGLHEMITDDQGMPVDYRFLKVNSAFADHTGLPAGEIIGKTVREILPDFYKRWVNRYAPTALAGKPLAFEDFEPTLGRHFSVRAYQTEPGKFFTMFFDVTEREKLSEQLRHAQKMQAVGQLAGGVAHEFNNILQIINGYVEMVLGQTPTQDPRHKALQRVMDSGLRAARLVQQLLAFSRRQILRPEPADINEVVRDFCKLAQKMVGETVTIRHVLEAHLGRVRIDRQLMEQVLLNLVINARDAMPSGGQIVVETADVDLDETDAQQTVQLNPGPYVMVAVADTGVGMGPEVMERIFEPFFTTKDVGQGTGLGLSVAYGIVRQHDGMIHVSSEPGQGTTFKIYLPRLVEEQEHGKGKELLESPSEKAFRGTGLILLAEDEPAVRECLAMALRDAGYKVLEAQNGMEAVEIFATTLEPIDCVVTDVVMPGMGGEEAVGLIRRTCGWIPAVFLGGYSERMHGMAARSSPNTVYLEKPVRRSALLRAVHELLAKGADSSMNEDFRA